MIISIILGTIFCMLSGFWLIAANVLPLWGQWALALAMWTLWLGSGCLAATAAELLNLRVIPHTLLGLCLPYIYPVWMIYRFRQKTARKEEVRQQQAEEHREEERANLANRFHAMQEKRDQERRERIAAQQGLSVEEVEAREEARKSAKTEVEPQTAASAAPAAEQQAAAPATDNEIYQLLYAQPVDQDGVRQGPFQFTLTTGGTIDIEGVRDLQPDFMVCTVYGTGKSVRMKYTQVESIARYATE